MLTRTLIIIAISFMSGAIPWAVLLGGLSLGVDIRLWGDHNPGGTNAWRAGGWQVGMPVLILDVLKGATGVVLARSVPDMPMWGAVACALAPVAGHAFSPFLNIAGGKAIASTLGMWTFLAGIEAGFVMGGGMIAAELAFNKASDAAKVGIFMSGVLGYLLLTHAPGYMFTIWMIDVAIMTFKQWQYGTLTCRTADIAVRMKRLGSPEPEDITRYTA